MSQLLSPTKVKYFYSVLYNFDEISAEKVGDLLENEFGAIKSFEPEFNPLTEYYTKEMGPSLKRIIFYKTDPENREEFVPLKVKATNLEIQHSKDGKRTINIDVGLVAKEQVLLATGKPYSHRIFLDQGVYAELVYFFKDKTFQKVPWTYPDYQHEEKIEFFNSIR